MPKAFRGLEAADNGNEFLCEKCAYGHIASGRHTEKTVHCRVHHSGLIQIRFRVTSCNHFRDITKKSTWSDLGADMKRIAYYLDRRVLMDGEENRNYMRFIETREAVKTDLIDEYDLRD